MLTGRPVIVTAIARGPTRVLRVPSNQMRKLLSMMPSLGEKLLIAFQVRRDLLVRSGLAGLKLVGPASCKDTTLAREFLYRNFVPFSWLDSASAEGQAVLVAWGSPRKTPAIQCSSGQILQNPSLRELARAAGIWRDCPNHDVDLIIVGAGPAGISCAVYASSEGLNTVVLDRLGPGGQTSGSSKIENFIGFPPDSPARTSPPAGCSRCSSSARTLVTPINVDRLEPAATPGDLHTLHLDCATPSARPPSSSHPASAGANSKPLAHSDSSAPASSSPAHRRGHALRQPGRRRGRCGKLRRPGRHVPRRVLPYPHRPHDHPPKARPGMSEYLADRIRATPNIRLHEECEITEVHGQRHPESVDIHNRHTGADINLPWPRSSSSSAPTRHRLAP
jgi:thioredoxin reductase (NADPH)